MNGKAKVLITGIGGASLGTEILKSLEAAGRYETFGCDISPFAFGHFQGGFRSTFRVSAEDYVNGVMQLCHDHKIQAVIPGGEEPLRLLSSQADVFRRADVYLAANSPEVTKLCSDKARFFEYAQSAGFTTPKTLCVRSLDEVDEFCLPCVVKPATGTGGSSFVFLATNIGEAKLYAAYLLANRGC